MATRKFMIDSNARNQQNKSLVWDFWQRLNNAPIEQLGDLFRVAAHPDIFAGVRGEGFILGLMCKVPNMDVVKAGYDQQVLTVPGGDNVVRLLPALTLTEEEISEAMDRLDAAATALEGQSDA